MLVRGETGSGKELVARVIHDAGPRANSPYVVLNLGAIPSTLAASELFGHVDGAFSGARGRNEGYFGRADGGTLFLDEIGETPLDVQPTLLRALETGEVQQIGARGVRRVDVRLVAATDADLEVMARTGGFRAPLIYRLATHEIRIPPLRERRDDIGRLLRHFLVAELTAVGRVDELRRPPPEDPWLPGPVVERLACYSWPGNVRQLRNVARYLAGMPGSPAPNDSGLTRLLADEAPATPPPTKAAAAPPPITSRRARPSDLDDGQVAAALARHDYRLGPAAKELGISRPSLNGLVEKHPILRRARLNQSGRDPGRPRHLRR